MSKENEIIRNGDFNELKTQDKRYSRSAFLKYTGKTFGSAAKGPMDGEYLVDEVITRYHKGLLHGGNDLVSEPQPAVILPDNHTEYWDMGNLHREEGPAVISKFGDWEEYWTHGTLIMIRAKGDITPNPVYKE
jgi:hypothetical protein